LLLDGDWFGNRVVIIYKDWETKKILLWRLCLMPLHAFGSVLENYAFFFQLVPYPVGLCPVLFFSRLILAFTWLFTIIAVIAGRFMIRELKIYLYKYSIGIRAVLIIGSNEVGEFLAMEIENNPGLGYQLLGIINGKADEGKAVKSIGTVEEFDRVIEKHGVHEVVLAQTNLSKSKVAHIINKCIENKISFKFVPDILASYSLNVRTGALGSMPIFELKTIALDGWGRIIKRIFDMVFSILILMISLTENLIAELRITAN